MVDQPAENAVASIQRILDAMWLPQFPEIPIYLSKHINGYYCEDIDGRMFCWEQQYLWPLEENEGSDEYEWFAHPRWHLEVKRCWFDLADHRLLRDKISSDQDLLRAYDELQKDACMFVKEAAEYNRDINLGRPRADWREIKTQLDRGVYADPNDEAVGNIPYLITEESRLAGMIEALSRGIRSQWNLHPQ